MLKLWTNFIALKSWWNYWKINAQKTIGIFEWTKNIYYKHGFHKGFSTAHDLINLTDTIESATDNKQFVYGVFMDLQKVFDTVDHDILIEKMHHYGIR